MEITSYSPERLNKVKDAALKRAEALRREAIDEAFDAGVHAAARLIRRIVRFGRTALHLPAEYVA